MTFVAELKERGMALPSRVTASDFARTLRFNGAGTDHSSGGNHMLLTCFLVVASELRGGLHPRRVPGLTRADSRDS